MGRRLAARIIILQIVLVGRRIKPNGKPNERNGEPLGRRVEPGGGFFGNDIEGEEENGEHAGERVEEGSTNFVDLLHLRRVLVGVSLVAPGRFV